MNMEQMLLKLFLSDLKNMLESGEVDEAIRKLADYIRQIEG